MDPHLYLQMREVEDRHWWFRGRRSIVAQALRTLELPKDARVLDAGCGTGGNLALLAGFGHVTGVESDAQALQMAQSRGVASILAGSLPDHMPMQGPQFDLVVMLDVLEHIEDDLGSLAALATLIKPGGSLCITVPAFQFLWSEHDVQHHHKRRYVAAGLRELLGRAGLAVRHLSYFNTVLFPVVAAVRIAQKLVTPKDMTGELSVPPQLINRALGAIFSAERHLVCRTGLPFGVSLLVVASKS